MALGFLALNPSPQVIFLHLCGPQLVFTPTCPVILLGHKAAKDLTRQSYSKISLKRLTRGSCVIKTGSFTEHCCISDMCMSVVERVHSMLIKGDLCWISLCISPFLNLESVSCQWRAPGIQSTSTVYLPFITSLNIQHHVISRIWSIWTKMILSNMLMMYLNYLYYLKISPLNLLMNL